jgi:hypothetical protein
MQIGRIMGLRWVLILAEVRTLPSKSQDSPSDLGVGGLEAKSRGAPLTISGHAGSKTGPAGDRQAAVSQYATPWNLCRFKF